MSREDGFLMPETCDNCMARPSAKLILDHKECEVAEVCDECVRYYMRTVVPLQRTVIHPEWKPRDG